VSFGWKTLIVVYLLLGLAEASSRISRWWLSRKLKRQAELRAACREINNERPADRFDRLTAEGYKLNLLTGEYYR
jgi:hypothetical protein